MPNLYVLTGDGITYTVVIHVVIPSVNNLAGINYQTALINSKVPNAGQTVLPVGAGPGQISATDYASLLAGGIYEVVTNFKPSGTDEAQLVTQLAGFATQIQAETIATLQKSLQYFGYTN